MAQAAIPVASASTAGAQSTALPGPGWRLIDLSLPLTPLSFETTRPRFKRTGHRAGARLLALKPLIVPRQPLQTLVNLLGYVCGAQRIPAAAFPDGQALAWETISAMTHRSTHVDAPRHYGPTCAGNPAATIDELDLSWFFAPAVRFDFRHKSPGDTISAAELAEQAAEKELPIAPGVITLIMTGTDARWQEPDYMESCPGMSREAVEWLLDRGVRVVGIDTDSLDCPGKSMLREYLSSRDGGMLWPAHFLGREREYYHLENLANLHLIPCDAGFWVSCFPIRVDAGTAGWTRAVAFVPASEEENG